MNCIDLTTNDQKCLVTSQNIENNSKLQKWSNYDEFASIWSRNDKNIDLRRKQFKTTQSYKTDQSTMNCIDWMTKRSDNAKLRKLSNYDELHRFHVNNAKLRKLNFTLNKNVELRRKPFRTTHNYKRDQITMNLHRYDVKKIENVELRRKTFKTTQYYESDQIIMNCIDLTSKRSIMLSYVAKHSKQR